MFTSNVTVSSKVWSFKHVIGIIYELVWGRAECANKWVPIKKASKRSMCTREPFRIHCGMFDGTNMWRVQNRMLRCLSTESLVTLTNTNLLTLYIHDSRVFACVSYNLLMLICVLPAHHSMFFFSLLNDLFSYVQPFLQGALFYQEHRPNEEKFQNLWVLKAEKKGLNPFMFVLTKNYTWA